MSWKLLLYLTTTTWMLVCAERPKSNADEVTQSKHDFEGEDLVTKGLWEPIEDSPKSAATYHRDKDRIVLGNLDNLGIIFGNPRQRASYSTNKKNNLLGIQRRDDVESAELSAADERAAEPIDNNEISRDVEPLEDRPESGDAFIPNKKMIVYGNLDNLGIIFGKIRQRWAHSTNRRNNALNKLALLRTRARNSRRRRKNYDKTRQRSSYSTNRRNDIQDKLALLLTREHNSRRRGTTEHFNGRLETRREFKEESSESSSSLEEINLQNPHTVHKGKYWQNYLWNHEMTGDSMNVNPKGPRFITSSGPELMYSRKWWYFNQDDYVPFG